jgi:DNA-directed RNA polymerase I and III subunit RPAC2
MQQKETEFCGYSVPHPYEPSMNIRLQTKEGGPSAIEVLKNGCQVNINNNTKLILY